MLLKLGGKLEAVLLVVVVGHGAEDLVVRDLVRIDFLDHVGEGHHGIGTGVGLLCGKGDELVDRGRKQEHAAAHRVAKIVHGRLVIEWNRRAVNAAVVRDDVHDVRDDVHDVRGIVGAIDGT